MPVWLQMTAALSSALCSGLMGIALIPFLRKCRFCEPDPNTEKQNSDTVSGDKLKPTMCGILLLFGCTAGFVLSYTLYLQFSGADRTGMDFQKESLSLRMVLIHGLLFGFLGWLNDYQRAVRRKTDTGETGLIVILLAFFLTYSVLKFSPEEEILNLGFLQWNAGALSVPVRAALVTVFFINMQKPEQNVDGISITVSSMQLLFLTIVCISGKQNLNALYALTAAGACLGCFYWNLYPAKCCLGQTGTYWLGMTVPMICLYSHRLDILLFYLAVWLINALPQKFRQPTLLGMLRQEGVSPPKRILILAGFALFCCLMTVMPEHS